MDSAQNPIARYKEARGLTYRQLAEQWGIEPGYLRRLAAPNKPAPVSKKMARHIEECSGGAIQAAELLLGDWIAGDAA